MTHLTESIISNRKSIQIKYFYKKFLDPDFFLFYTNNRVVSKKIVFIILFFITVFFIYFLHLKQNQTIWRFIVSNCFKCDKSDSYYLYYIELFLPAWWKNNDVWIIGRGRYLYTYCVIVCIHMHNKIHKKRNKPYCCIKC